jgi:hypothetical protein
MKTQTVQYVPHTSIKVRENFNPRVKPFTEDLKPSILAHGVRDAVEVEQTGDGEYLLNAQGHRRLLALTELVNEGHKKAENGDDLLMPIKVVDAVDNINKLRTDIITLNTGKPLEMIEEARVYGQIVEGIEDKKLVREKAKELAEITGKSINGIMNLLSLLEAGPVITKLIESGKASASLAIELFLSGPAKGDWSKVETALVAAVAEAAQAGKTKASKKDVTEKDKKDGKTPEEEAEEASEKADREAVKARNKELIGLEKRVMKFSDFAVALDRESQTGVPLALIDLMQITAMVLYPEAKADLKLEGDFSNGDINANYKKVIRESLAAVKESADGYKAAHKEEITKLKLEHKAELEALKAKLTAKK